MPYKLFILLLSFPLRVPIMPSHTRLALDFFVGVRAVTSTARVLGLRLRERSRLRL